MTKTPELDADGNPITPGGDEVVTLTKEEHEKMVLDLATKAQAAAALLTEVTQLRTKNAELSKEKKPEPTEVEKVVKQELAKKEADQAKANYEQASRNFLDTHPEFSTENDPGGVKFAAFNKALGRINLTTLQTVEEFNEALGDAYGLMERKSTVAPVIVPAPRAGGQAPKAQAISELPEKEARIVKDYFAGDVAKYLKEKAKKPEFFEVLLEHAR